jgi:aldehyde dehydrogenase (NAD+)
VLGELPFEMPFAEHLPTHQILLEPIGVAALITPWNWPMNQICLKVGAAVAAGCTVVLKPSEVAPMSAILFAEFADEAGLPPGVFNLIQGDGAQTGTALVTHPDVDMVSFTGSTRAGIAISKAAADSVKRVSLELGGKSPNIVFADCDLEARVRHGLASCFSNSGQSCNAPTRMLVERSVYDRAVLIAADAASNTLVDLPESPGSHIGPLVSAAQFEKVQWLINGALSEGTRLVAGGAGRPSNMPVGWYVRPTVFADVSQDMTIWRDEVFGPVLVMAPFDDEDDAVRLANDTPFGLSAYLQTGSPERAKRMASRLRAGMVHINGASRAPGMPFGGYKQSGNGREGGHWGVHEFLEVKSVSGWPVA